VAFGDQYGGRRIYQWWRLLHVATCCCLLARVVSYVVLSLLIPRFVSLVSNADLSSFDNNNQFFKNLVTDLAPPLTLFDEEVTKQFLSQAMGWVDDILFAMGPLGTIVRGITCPIQAGDLVAERNDRPGARNASAVDSVELLSSTLDQVCELYSEEVLVIVPENRLLCSFSSIGVLARRRP
jgi:hypothetical protein